MRLQPALSPRAEVEVLRREIPDELRRFRDLDFRKALSDQITLSTFHGCPAAEIEGIVRFLLEELDVHVTVKLNPTLLGRETVDRDALLEAADDEHPPLHFEELLASEHEARTVPVGTTCEDALTHEHMFV